MTEGELMILAGKGDASARAELDRRWKARAEQIAKLSARQLEALYEKRQAVCSKNCTSLINAGRGMERGGEIYAKGKAGADALSVEYVRATDAVRLVIAEMEARKRWHGSLNPIKRAS